tara:strand:+ start:991 stop:1152 length:162 start_codon:yes stop_codon:yes gene_type:complete
MWTNLPSIGVDYACAFMGKDTKKLTNRVRYNDFIFFGQSIKYFFKSLVNSDSI